MGTSSNGGAYVVVGEYGQTVIRLRQLPQPNDIHADMMLVQSEDVVQGDKSLWAGYVKFSRYAADKTVNGYGCLRWYDACRVYVAVLKLNGTAVVVALKKKPSIGCVITLDHRTLIKALNGGAMPSGRVRITAQLTDREVNGLGALLAYRAEFAR